MRLFSDYINDFLRGDATALQQELGQILLETQAGFSVSAGGNPVGFFDDFVSRYNWLGDRATKDRYSIAQNLARNLPGAMMQDWLINLICSLLRPYPTLNIFTEVKVRFGFYPLWNAGEVALHSPSERSDLCVGYLVDANNLSQVYPPEGEWPRTAVSRLPAGTAVIPLITINSKIRVSQSEFFDWQGRETLMTKGNPNCLSLQVALRKEMDSDIVEAAQAYERWFLIGNGTETNVVPDHEELQRLIHVVGEHLRERMT